MSLNFDFSRVQNQSTVCTDPSNPEKWHPVAEGLVWLSLTCGFSSIERNNVEKVTARVLAYQLVTGPYLRNGRGDTFYITAADVERFVGMRTNATQMSDSQWAKRLVQFIGDDVRKVAQKWEPAHTKYARLIDQEAAA